MRKDSRISGRTDAVAPNEHPPAEDLARYIDGMGAGRDGRTAFSYPGPSPAQIPLPAPLIEHVENCVHCQGQILDVLFYLRNPLRGIDPLQVADTPPVASRRPAWLFPALRIAAAAFVLILLSTVFFRLPRRHLPAPETAIRNEPLQQPLPVEPPPQPGSEDRAPARRQGDKDRRLETAAEGSNARGREFPDAYAVNPNLESMVGSRSRGLSIEVYSPPNQARLTGEITFSWKEFKRESLSLVIVDNRNDAVFRSPVSGGSFLFRGTLRPGCYYWKLESPSELYYVGKFLVPAGPTSPGG